MNKESEPKPGPRSITDGWSISPNRFLFLLPLILLAVIHQTSVAAIAPEPDVQAVTTTMAVKQFHKTMTLPPLQLEEASNLAALDPGADIAKGKLQIGLRRSFGSPVVVNKDTVGAGEWVLLPDGSRLWSAEISAQGARGLRLHLQGVKLPDGASFVAAPIEVAAAPGSAVSVSAGDLAGASDVWMPTVFSDHIVLECQVPEGISLDTVAFALDSVSHLYDSPAGTEQKAGPCHNDVACQPAWAAQAAGVARISFVEFGNTYVCSGGLLADYNQDSIASWFMTAKHCVGSQTIASTMEVYWLFQTSQCGAPAPWISEAPRTAGGADFVAATAANDFALLRLRRSPPSGVYYLGWTGASISAGEAVTTIHHPGENPKRISFGSLHTSDPAWWKVKWNSGVTEPGSSGAPLFNSRHEVVGLLYGGASSCSNPKGTDNFGRLDVSYETLLRWLGPGAAGAPQPDVAVPAGAYSGLFARSSGISLNTSGSINLTITRKGAFSGKVRMNSGTHSFSGRFASTGRAILTIRRAQAFPLTLDLQADPGDPDQMRGTLGDGTWMADVTVDRAFFNAKSDVAAQAGRYTFGLPDSDDQGNGFATVTISKAGKVRLAGRMPDGVAWSKGGPISKAGDFPMWSSLYSRRGMICGWLSFPAGDWTNPDGEVNWTRPASTAYSEGELSQQISMLGSRYVQSQTVPAIFPNGNAYVTLGGAGLSQTLGYVVQMRTASKASGVQGSSGKITLSLSHNGLFKGRLSGSPELGSQTLQGVILQSHNEGLGLFNQRGVTGSVWIRHGEN